MTNRLRIAVVAPPATTSSTSPTTTCPNLEESVPPMAGSYERPGTRSRAETVAFYDGFVLVTPGYNHGPSGALKNALDHLYAEWNHKAVGFAS